MAQAQAIPGHGTTFRILKAGDGPAIKKGSTATVHATGVVKEGGKKFWSTKDPGQQPFTYTAGVGQVITGWGARVPGVGAIHPCLRRSHGVLVRSLAPSDQGCLGMKVGEQRELEIPSTEGYGAAGFPAWGIGGNSTLLFTLECLSVQ